MVEVSTTKFGGHSAEFWAEQLVDKICGYSKDAEVSCKNKQEPTEI